MPEIKDLRSLKPIPARSVGSGSSLSVPLQSYSNAYDENYRPEYNQIWNRSDNQSALEQWSYGLLSRGLSIIPKMGNGLGALYGAVTADDLNGIWNNSWNEFFNSIDENLRETLPVYQSMKYDQSGLLGKMGTSSFWANDFFDGLAFAASSYVPGGLIGKATSAGAKALSTTQLAKSLGMTIKGLEKGAHVTNLALSTAYNTLAEASVEAYQTQKDIEAQLISQGVDANIAKQKAGEAAARVFRANSAILAVPNLIENTLFHGGFGDLGKKVRKSVWDNNGKLADELAATEAMWSKVLKGVGTEGLWEENSQTSIQQYEKAIALYGLDPGGVGDYSAQVLSHMGKNIVGFAKGLVGAEDTPEEIEGATSIFLGALIGGGMGALSTFRERSQAKKLKDQEESRYAELFDKYGPAALGLFQDNVNSIYKTKGKKELDINGTKLEINEHELDADGNAIIDSNALINRSLNSLKDKSLWDATMLAAYRNDPALGELTKETALASYAYNLVSHQYDYTDEEIATHLNRLSKVAENTAELEDTKTFIGENINKIKQYVSDLRAISDKRSSVKQDLNNPEESKFNSFLTKSEFYLHSKLNALKTLENKATTPEGKQTINNMIEDTVKYLNQINTEVEGIRKEYDKTIINPQKLYSELDKLETASKKTPLTDEEVARRDELRYLLSEDKAINGDWIKTNSSRSLPAGAELITLSSITPGTRDFFNRELGKTTLALSKIEEGIEADPHAAGIDFVRNVTLSTESNQQAIETVRQKIDQKLGESLAPTEQRLQEISAVSSILNNLSVAGYSSEAETLGEFLDEQVAPEELEGTIELLAKNGLQIDPTAAFDPNTFGQEANQVAATLKQEQDPLIEEYRQVAGLRTAVNNSQTLTETNARAKSFADASNKEAFLKKDFYVNEIKRPAEGLITVFKDDEESFINDYAYYVNLAALRAVVNAYTKRTDANVPSDVLPDAQELLKYYEQTIGPKLNQNLNKIAERHREVNNKLTNEGLNALGFGKNQAELKNLVDKIVGDNEQGSKVKQLYDEVFADEDTLSFDALLILVNHIRKVASKEQLEELIKAVTAYTQSVGKSFSEQETIASLKLKQTGEQITKNLIRNLNKEIRFLFSKYFNENYPDVVSKYLNDFDIESLLTGTKYSKLKEKDANFIRLIASTFYQITAANIVLETLNGEVDISKLVEAKASLEEVSPSLQQNIVLTQAVNFLFTDANLTNYNNWFLSLGIGGSGKTFLIANLVPKLYKELTGTDLNIVAFSSNQRTTSNINKAIFGKETKSNLQSFLSSDPINAPDVLILDEVFTFTDAETALIQTKISNIKKETGKIVKVIALGDPSQATAETNPQLLNQIDIKIANPLTTSYRTSVNEIANFTSRYQLKSKPVESNNAILNIEVSELLTDPKQGFGVASITFDQIQDVLSVPSPRTRVLIVDTERAKAAYSGKFPNVAVLTVKEAQGYQWEEVYTVLDPTNLGETPLEVNKMLYTAYSRAEKLLVIAGAPITQSSPNTGMEQTIKNSEYQMEKAKEMYNTNLSLAKTAKNILDGTPTFNSTEMSTADAQNIDTPPVDEGTVSSTSYADVPEEDPLDTVVEEVPSSGRAELSYPTNRILNGPSSQIKHVAINSVAHVIRTTNEGVDEYYVIAPSVTAPETYVIIGMLGDEDFNGPAGEYFNEIIKNRKSQTVDTRQITRSDTFVIPNNALPNMSLGQLSVLEYQTFKTITDPTVYIEDPNQYMLGAKDAIEDAIIRFYVSYYGVNANGAALKQTNDDTKR